MVAIDLRPGVTVKLNGETVRIEHIASFDTIVVSDRQQRIQSVPVLDILRAQEDGAAARKATKLDGVRAAKVDRYATAFAHVLDPTCRTVAEIKKACDALSISLSSAYRALNRFDQFGTINELPPPTRSGGKGKSRLGPDAEQIIQKHLKMKHPGAGRVARSQFIRALKRELQKQGLAVADDTLWARLKSYDPGPSRNSRRNRTQGLPTRDVLTAYYPSTRRPLEIVQLDHWQADAEIVSEDRLSTIGRFTVTMGIDVHTRMVYCVHMGLHSPGSIPFGLAMINGMTHKYAIEEKFDIKGFPMAGVPHSLLLDNAGEFTGHMVQKACSHFGIKLTLRPIKSPEYGCHIERLLGNLALRFKELPGATGSNTEERKEFDPERTAAMTLEDMERQIWLLISRYHQEPHPALGGKTPLQAYESHYFDQTGQIRTLPKFYTDDINLWIHWWPVAYRTIRTTGVRYQELDYVSDELATLLRRKAEWGNHKLEIRIDPLSAKHIYLKHPEDANRWLKLHCRIIGMPDVSQEQVRNAIKQARAEKRKPAPGVILDLIKRQEENVAQAIKLTKKARRRAARAQHEQRMRRERDKAVSNVATGGQLAPTSSHRPSDAPAKPIGADQRSASLQERLAQISEDDIADLL